MTTRLDISKFKPMLSAKGITPYSALSWEPESPGLAPYFGSVKLDGIRGTNLGEGQMLSRTLKPIPSKKLQELLGRKELAFLDGELIYGDAFAEDVYHKTYSAVMAEGASLDRVRFHVFDHVEFPDLPYISSGNCRVDLIHRTLDLLPKELLDFVTVNYVAPVPLTCEEDLKEMESGALENGFEGVMLRRPGRGYKFGRSSESAKRQELLRRKPLDDSEAVILAVDCSYENRNEAYTNELGRTARATNKENLVAKDTLGRIFVRDLYTNKEFWIGIFKGFSAQDLQRLWEKRDALPGLIVKYQFMPVGVKDLPRHPRMVGFRDKGDM